MKGKRVWNIIRMGEQKQVDTNEWMVHKKCGGYDEREQTRIELIPERRANWKEWKTWSELKCSNKEYGSGNKRGTTAHWLQWISRERKRANTCNVYLICTQRTHNTHVEEMKKKKYERNKKQSQSKRHQPHIRKQKHRHEQFIVTPFNRAKLPYILCCVTICHCMF